MVKSSVTLVRLCPSGLAGNVRRPQEVALRVVRVFRASNFCDLGCFWEMTTLGSTSWGGHGGKETKVWR